MMLDTPDENQRFHGGPGTIWNLFDFSQGGQLFVICGRTLSGRLVFFPRGDVIGYEFQLIHKRPSQERHGISMFLK